MTLSAEELEVAMEVFFLCEKDPDGAVIQTTRTVFVVGLQHNRVDDDVLLFLGQVYFTS